MRISQRVTSPLFVALAGLLAAGVALGQGQPAASAPSSQRPISNTRSASCIVRITVDPAIIPLNPVTVQGLLHSSAVADRAMREVLGLDATQLPPGDIIEIEWLDGAPPRPFRAAGTFGEEASAYNRELQRQLDDLYGEEYMKQMGMKAPAAGESSPARPGVERTPASGDERERMLQKMPRIYAPPTATPEASTPQAGFPRGVPFGGPGWGAGPYGVEPALGSGQEATVKLSIHLADSVPPAAEELLAALVENLRGTLTRAHDGYVRELRNALEEAESRHGHAVEALQEGPSPATASIRERLETIVDLSAWSPQMPLSEAVELLRKSVDPPLNIVVLWNDLMDSLQVEPATPINLDGMPSVRVGTALDLLVRGMPSVGGRPVWRIKDDAIVIATAAALGDAGEPAGLPTAESDPGALAAQRNGLANKLQDLELSLAGQEARQAAILQQMTTTRHQIDRKLAGDQVLRELQDVLGLAVQALSQEEGKYAPGHPALQSEAIRALKEQVARAKIEVARRREEIAGSVGGRRLEEFNAELGRLAIDRAEKEAQGTVLHQQLDRVEQQMARAALFDPEAARARLGREMLDILARRVAELQMRLANLQPPVVTVIGAN